MRKSFKYRLYPNKQQKNKIDQTLETCRILYNDFLFEKKEFYEKEQKRLTFFDQINSLPIKKENNYFLKEVYSQILQDVAQRVDKSFQNFFQRIKKQIDKVGYPRFKQYGRYYSFTYTQSGFKSINDKKIYLSKLGNINIKKHRELLGKIKTCSVIVKNGKYYACFSCEAESKLLTKTGKKIGIDMGLTSFLTTSNGDFKKSPKIYQKVEQKLAKSQRKVSRRIKGSKRRKKAIIILSKQHEKIVNQRKDFAHKLSRELVNNYDLIAHEKLQIKNMVKNRYLVKSINDASWNLFLTILSYKAEEAGKEIVKVDARDTSQICNQCGKKRKIKLELNQKIFFCSYCNYKDNRDTNAALNILKRAERLGTDLQGAGK